MTTTKAILQDAYYKKRVWEDIQRPALNQKLYRPQGKIDYNYSDGGVNFQNGCDAQDYVVMTFQLPHGLNVMAELRPHIHWIQTAGTGVVWGMKYRFYNNGETVPTSWTDIPLLVTKMMPYSSGSMLQIDAFAHILKGVAKHSSAFLDVRLWRDSTDAQDNTNATVLLKQFDFHGLMDTMGSRLEFHK